MKLYCRIWDELRKLASHRDPGKSYVSAFNVDIDFALQGVLGPELTHAIEQILEERDAGKSDDVGQVPVGGNSGVAPDSLDHPTPAWPERPAQTEEDLEAREVAFGQERIATEGPGHPRNLEK